MQHVVATAGHVDHGKPTLVRALTGIEPDRWAEERRRGLTIDLGFAWADLAPGRTIAFVDVPGHERFVANMLAGVGPVPAAMLVVAADGGWMPQTEEHVAALAALGVRHALVALTRTDLVDSAQVATVSAEVHDRLAATTLGGAETVAVSATTGDGLGDLRRGLLRMVERLPAADPAAPVRLWVDRSFTVRGAGTVVTGTLTAGRVAVGDGLRVGDRAVTVRAVESLGVACDEVTAVARVALNLRGVAPEDVRRGSALLSPQGPWVETAQVDVRTTRQDWARPAALTLHLGSAAVPVRLRPLSGGVVRLGLDHALPLRAGDTGLLRDPGRHLVVAGLTVVDPAPVPLHRRGAASARGAELAALDASAELRRRGVMTTGEMSALGLDPPVPATAGRWHVDPDRAAAVPGQLADLLARHRAAHPLDDGPSVEAATQALALPDRRLLEALVRPPFAVRAGRVVAADSQLPAYVLDALDRLAKDLADAPFAAPDAARLRELRLEPPELAAAERAGRLLRIADGVVLLPEAPDLAAEALAGLAQPFSVAEARTALGSSRRVTVPLLELLDRLGRTRRGDDDRRTVATPSTGNTGD